LDEKPAGRKPVTTTAAPTARMDEVIGRLRQAVNAGAQAFWICPLVAESEVLDVTAAEARAATLQEALGESTVGLVHGKLAPAEKD
ncbi:ATP-dependent DNA helicase RecG, partial [Acinetobacter baumannii]